MSWGLTPYDFVQQVFYAQEKVLLDFRPTDDKYKEVLVEANLVLQELQKEEDWTWLRDQLVLGSCEKTGFGEIPEFRLPQWVYKVSTLHDDCVRLHRIVRPCGCCGTDMDPHDFIEVPFGSVGRLAGRTMRQRRGPMVNVPDRSLCAAVVGDNVLTFNRILTPWEADRIAVCDVQRRIEPIHICGPKCKGVDPDEPISYERNDDGDWENPCSQIEDRILTQIPDPNYVVVRTAALHAEGSPPAQGRVQSLADNAQKLLSAMRQNDASATDADYLDWDPLWHVDVV